MEDIPESSQVGRKPKRVWTAREDEALVESLLQICREGKWKVENGFKAGYLTKLQSLMEEKIAGCDLKATPHILSRLKTLKKQTVAIFDMANTSGFVWDEDHKMITNEKAVYDEWVKGHPDAAGLRCKPFIHYDNLLEAFGKERATGAGVKTPQDVLEDLDKCQEAPTREEVEVLETQNDQTWDDIYVTDPLSSQPTPTGATQLATGQSPPINNSGTTPSTKLPVRRKRSREPFSSGLGELASTFGRFVDITAQHMTSSQQHMSNNQQNLATMLSLEKDEVLSRKRAIAMKEIETVPELTVEDMFLAGHLITNDIAKLEFFLSLSSNLKVPYIAKILGSNR